ncbi:MAG TPA: glycoside hydrolase family 31 protein [Ktedonobacteraceae bacterium]|nr:glycoside hydrolase family 31 protein [Ktedonobacteraceae bacterium]
MQLFRQLNNTLLWETHNNKLQIEPWGRDSLRVRSTVSAEIRDDLFSVLLPPTSDTDVQIVIREEGAVISNGALTATISPQGILRFSNTISETELLAESQPATATRIPPRFFKAVAGELFHLEARFRAYDGERFYGLGQHQHGRLDQKGCTIDLIQRNTEVSIPFFLSSRGYGFLWHNPAVGRVELGNNETRWVAEATPQLDYWITAGATPAEIMEHYADATGHAPEFPEWAAGFWQCKLRYRTQDELLSVAREYKRRGLPLSVIIIDFFHWTLQGDWRFDPEAWPDPEAMVRELKAMGVELMVSIWATVNPLSENFPAMQARGLLIRTERGNNALMPFFDHRPEGPAYLHYYDATNPEARRFVWEQVQEHYYQQGVRHYWLDACEPEMFPTDPDNLRFHLGQGLAIANAYPLLHERGFYEHMRAAGETAVLNLCRSAWAGSQRYGAAVWSGDISSTFEALQAQVRAGLNMALSGIPWWTTDIGGFHGGNPESPSFRELVVRWFQYGAFCPLFRLHGHRQPVPQEGMLMFTGGPNEVWSFGDEEYAIIKDLLFLRERLRPYILEQMQCAHEHGIPPMRPLFFDFPEDEACHHIDDQFLFGPDLLVAPVVVEGARHREVYLPAGTTWTDAWRGQIFDGGHYITADAPLERIPLYLRGDAELPIREGNTRQM